MALTPAEKSRCDRERRQSEIETALAEVEMLRTELERARAIQSEIEPLRDRVAELQRRLDHQPLPQSTPVAARPTLSPELAERVANGELVEIYAGGEVFAVPRRLARAARVLAAAYAHRTLSPTEAVQALGVLAAQVEA
jgi:hypothetical protein